MTEKRDRFMFVFCIAAACVAAFAADLMIQDRTVKMEVLTYSAITIFLTGLIAPIFGMMAKETKLFSRIAKVLAFLQCGTLMILPFTNIGILASVQPMPGCSLHTVVSLTSIWLGIAMVYAMHLASPFSADEVVMVTLNGIAFAAAICMPHCTFSSQADMAPFANSMLAHVSRFAMQYLMPMAAIGSMIFLWIMAMYDRETSDRILRKSEGSSLFACLMYLVALCCAFYVLIGEILIPTVKDIVAEVANVAYTPNPAGLDLGLLCIAVGLSALSYVVYISPTELVKEAM